MPRTETNAFPQKLSIRLSVIFLVTVTNPDRRDLRLRVPEGSPWQGSEVAGELAMCLVQILMDQDTDLMLQEQLGYSPQGLPLMADLSRPARSHV